jgi:hypothetical protein
MTGRMTRTLSRRRAAILAGEFVLVVLGVLVALALDQWRARRHDRSLEAAYVARLRGDLVTDTARFGWFTGVLDTKDAVLHELLLPPAPGDVPLPALARLSRVRHSTFIGLPPVTAATFNELLSTGSVNLLRSDDLRAGLGEYYAFYARLTTILDLLPGPYRDVVWSSMPGDVEHTARRDTLRVDTLAVLAGLARLRAHPQLRAAINHELYYAAGLREYLTDANRRAVVLLRQIDGLYGTPRPASKDAPLDG